METTVITAALIIGIITYLLRMLPMLWSAARVKDKKTNTNDSWTKATGPILITALLAVSVIHEQKNSNVIELISTLCALLICWLVYLRTENFGLAIITTVFAYASLLFFLS